MAYYHGYKPWSNKKEIIVKEDKLQDPETLDNKLELDQENIEPKKQIAVATPTIHTERVVNFAYGGSYVNGIDSVNNKLVSKIEERTLVIIKPDAILRGLVGNIINMIENVGITIVAMKFGKICILNKGSNELSMDVQSLDNRECIALIVQDVAVYYKIGFICLRIKKTFSITDEENSVHYSMDPIEYVSECPVFFEFENNKYLYEIKHINI
jgi:hypothetical protein